MLPTNQELQELERESYRIVGMICAETSSEVELDTAIDELRRRTALVFPGRPRVFERTFESRIIKIARLGRHNPTVTQWPFHNLYRERILSSANSLFVFTGCR